MMGNNGETCSPATPHTVSDAGLPNPVGSNFAREANCPPPSTGRILPRRYVYSREKLWALRHDDVDCSSSSSRGQRSPRRYVYSREELQALRHDRVVAVPENITKPLDHEKYEIPTLKPNKPTPFSDLSLPKELLSALSSMSLTTASAIQATAIPYARLGADLVAQATSGTGKTLTYALVALDIILPATAGRTAFVIVPTRELAYQVADLFEKLAAVRVVTLVGGTRESVDQENLSRHADVIVGTPGRVEVMVTREAVDISSIRILVLDEADRLLDGSFGGSVERICNMIPNRQTLAFSATFSFAFKVSLMEVMREPAWIGGSEVVHSVLQRKIACRNLSDKITTLKGMLQPVNLNLCLVFFNAKKAAGRLVRTLNKSLAFMTKLIHAGITQKERDAVIREVREGNVHVLVTTDVLARGIDFDSCDMVIQMDVPQKVETYLHRVGRAGRFGRKGSSTLLYDETEVSAVVALESDLGYDIKSPTVPRGVTVFMPMKSSPSNAAKSVSENDVLVKKPRGERSIEHGTKDLEKLAETKLKALRAVSHALGSSPPYADKREEEDDSTDNMDLEAVELPPLALKPRLTSSPKKAADPASHIATEQVGKRRLTERTNGSAEGTFFQITGKGTPCEDEAKKRLLTYSPLKRPGILEEPATPAKKRRSARILLEPFPNQETGPFDRGHLKQNTSFVPTYHDDHGSATKDESLASNPSTLFPPHHSASQTRPSSRPERNNDNNLYDLDASLAHKPSTAMEVDTGESSIEELTRKTCRPNSSAAASRKLIHRARDPTKDGEPNNLPALSQTQAEVNALKNDTNKPYQNSDKDSHIEPAADAPLNPSPAVLTEQSRDAWERYAATAYDAGYREAYKEAFQIAERLRQRLGPSRS